jgi:predicted dehydrogenase
MALVSVILVGVGGYGRIHINSLLSERGRRRVKVVGAVDPYPAGEGYDRLTAEGIPVYASAAELYACHTPELAIICCPTPFHAEHAAYCMEHGSHVLVEKPIAPSLAAAEAMIKARDKTGRALVVGYQWCFHDTLARFREAARSGTYGAPKTFRAMVLWPRDESYYKRGIGWAGRRYTADGHEAFDSVASNATAHYLMNMLWVAGYGEDGVDVARVEAAAARANDIEMFDTICMDVRLSNGVRILFAASHAVSRGEAQEPMFSYEFERATASYGALGERGGRLLIDDKRGGVSDFGNVGISEASCGKIWKTLDIISGKLPNLCRAELALGHTKVMDLVNKIVDEKTVVFSPEQIHIDESLRWVPGLAHELHGFYKSGKLPELKSLASSRSINHTPMVGVTSPA